jgi:hypothetical protein
MKREEILKNPRQFQGRPPPLYPFALRFDLKKYRMTSWRDAWAALSGAAFDINGSQCFQ